MSTADPFATLHERIVAHLDEVDRLLVTPVRGYQALRAVVELHDTFHYDRFGMDCCGECSNVEDGVFVDAPCSTIQAIARELGVDGG